MNEEQLFDAYLRKELSEADTQLMLERVSTDEEFSDRLMEYIYSTHLIIKSAKSAGANALRESKRIKSVKIEPRKVAKLFIPATVKFVSAALIALGFILFFAMRQTVSNSFSLHAFHSAKDIYYKGYPPLKELDKVEAGEVLEYRNSSGTKVVFEGPAKYQINNDGQIYLERGKVFVSLTEKTQSFVLKTPYGSARDLGTAFGSEVREGEMDLHVFDGIVEFGPQNVKATEGYAYSLKADMLHRINYNPEKFTTEVPKDVPKQKINLLAGEVIDFKLSKQIDRLKLKISPVGIKAAHGQFEFRVSSNSKIIKSVNLVDLKNSHTLLLENLKGLNSLNFTLKSYRNRGIDEAAGSLNITLYDSQITFPETLISSNANWHYQKAIHVENTEWFKMRAIPDNWLEGASPIGFGREVNTELNKEHSPLYVYKEFIVSDVPAKGTLLLNLSFDDGGIIYLNGHEIFRINIEDKFIDKNSRADRRSESSMESIYTTVKIPLTYLKPGKNVLTAATCQFTGGDMLFDLKLSLQQ